MEVCICSRCIINTILNDEGQPISGKYLTTRNIAKHLSEDYKRFAEVKHHTSNQPDPQSDSPSVEITESSGYLEESRVFEGLDQNEHNFHLFDVSRENCRTAITALFNILKETIRQRTSNQSLLKMPRDPRTLISKANLEIELVESICCGACFHLYPNNTNTPLLCEYAPFAHSQRCNEELYKQIRTQSGFKDLGRFPNPKHLYLSTVRVP
ncbi:hypothetical protein PGTUg99_024357 [Puccinia graminis f. sp. tritici]|uniref:Uncharacterized protein n=1 Tax=Puccinia graminis f. sp. tritici TaxID=56615 RepID=A0A5B0SJ80_PUCGR|nr:hypothetical protein PGTUg99_024357 [Puccinia graminis f. sp. tritici]